jgi:chaperonin cofactor prefoldin
MSDTRDIEKKSLEAHVELCAERYRFLENKMDTVDRKISALEDMMQKVYDTINEISHRRNDQIINWGIGIMAALLGIIGYLLAVYVIK